MKRADSRPRVAILGCGAVGRALVIEMLSERPASFRGQLRVWSRSRRSIAKLQKLFIRSQERRLQILDSAEVARADADVLLLCLSDETIEPMARRLAQAEARGHVPVVLITSGYLPLACLAPLRRAGWSVGRMHPLVPIRPGLERMKLIHAPWAIEGDRRAIRAAKRLIKGLSGKVLLLTNRPGSAAAYHAGASLFSGGLVALFHLAERVMSESVTSRVALRNALDDFAESTLENIVVLGPRQALTGALARGSESLVRGHLVALRRIPAALELYRLLGKSMLELAESRGSIDAVQSRSLLGILGERRDRKVRKIRRSRLSVRRMKRSG